MNICMIGAGYVGLVSAACFSEFGWTVTCIDKDHSRVESLKRGEVPIYEPGLDDLMQRNIAAGRLSNSTDLGPAAASAYLIFSPSERPSGAAMVMPICRISTPPYPRLLHT